MAKDELHQILMDLKRGQDELVKGQKERDKILMELKCGQEKLAKGQEKLAKGQDELFKGQEKLTKGQDELFKGQDELFVGQKQLIEEQKEIKAELRKLSETVAKIEVEHGQRLEILLDVVTGQIKKLNSEEQRIEKCEKRLDKHDDQFYYLNVTSIKEKENYIEDINKSLALDAKIKQVPTIVYIKEGKVVDIIERNDDNMMNVGDFQKLLDIYYVTK